MKRIIMALTVIALLATLLTNSYASDRSVNGLIIGGGTGAIVGQAIGQNTESTIIGATVGGVLGLLIGSEIGHHDGSVRHYSRQEYSHPDAGYYPQRPRLYANESYYYDDRGPAYERVYIKKRNRYNIRPVFSNGYRDERRHHIKQHNRDRRHDRSSR